MDSNPDLDLSSDPRFNCSSDFGKSGSSFGSGPRFNCESYSESDRIDRQHWLWVLLSHRYDTVHCTNVGEIQTWMIVLIQSDVDQELFISDPVW